MQIVPEELLKIFLALVVGGIIGLERQYREKAAGFRTLIFICIGSTIFTLLSQHIGGPSNPDRIAANIVSGIGFLGAGVIIRENGRLIGITTAATIWFVAALGMGLGAGEYAIVALAVVLALIVLVVFPRPEQWLNTMHVERTYEIKCSMDPLTLSALDALIRGSGLMVHSFNKAKADDCALCTWGTSGPNNAHVRLVEGLFNNIEVKEFHY